MYQDKYFRSWNSPFQFNEGTINTEAPSGFGVYQVLKKRAVGLK